MVGLWCLVFGGSFAVGALSEVDAFFLIGFQMFGKPGTYHLRGPGAYASTVRGSTATNIFNFHRLH